MIKVNGEKVQTSLFPDGSSSVNFAPTEGRFYTVSVDWQGSPVNETFVQLIMVLNTLRRRGVNLNSVGLSLGYMPGGRADREFNIGDNVPVKDYASIINSFGLKSVTLMEPHSLASIRALDNVQEYSREPYYIMKRFDCNNIIFPDKGAYDRYNSRFEEFKCNLIYLKKVRMGKDLTVDLIGEIPENLDKVVLVDDICDGGKTFIEAAKLIKSQCGEHVKVCLSIAHGIFSKGLEVFKPYLYEIEAENIICNYVDKFDIMRFNAQQRGEI